MKSLLSALSVVCLFATACNSSSGQKYDPTADQNARTQATLDSLKLEMTKKNIRDSMAFEMAKQEEARKVEVQTVRTVHASPATHTTVIHETTTTQAPQKKGWSATAKGAVIGAGTGAVVGAIVDKNRLEGGVVGGVVGAGAGAGVGAIIDKSKKNKEQRGK